MQKFDRLIHMGQPVFLCPQGCFKPINQQDSLNFS
jgi:hypothetical protein